MKNFIKKIAFVILVVGLFQCQNKSGEETSQITEDVPTLVEKNIYWGDIHNHCNVGYAKGSLERAYDIAQSHLDFFCFTPHSQWHDKQDKERLNFFTRGFEVTRDNWGKVKTLANEANRPGEFVSFIGYEWHSSGYGDVCLIMPDNEGELSYYDDIRDLQAYARNSNAILIPHHPAYKQGMRGQNWEVLGGTDVSPVVEIYSEHGNAESDRGPHPYIRHSMGGRYTQNTLQYLWNMGKQVGVVASTDDHLGYPGAYGEGLVAVHADTLTREGIMEAIKAKRTYAVTADRIELDFRLNGHWMGETIENQSSRKIDVKVKGKDVIDRIEVLRNNEVIHRECPVDKGTSETSWDKPVFCRIEFGWEPWSFFNTDDVTDWTFDINVTDGKILSATPCFQSSPYKEDKRNKIINVDDSSCQFLSYTSRKDAFEERPTNSVILEIQGTPETDIEVSLSQPKQLTVNKTLGQLSTANDIFFMGDFPSESVMLHRIVYSENYSAEFSFEDNRETDSTDWYYVRVIQSNGSLAWSSPIWVGK